MKKIDGYESLKAEALALLSKELDPTSSQYIHHLIVSKFDRTGKGLSSNKVETQTSSYFGFTGKAIVKV